MHWARISEERIKQVAGVMEVTAYITTHSVEFARWCSCVLQSNTWMVTWAHASLLQKCMSIGSVVFADYIKTYI